MVFKKKSVKKLGSEEAPLYVKEEKEKEEATVPEEVIPIRIVNLEPELTDTERAMKHFGVSQLDIFRLKDYPDKIVVITNDGRKLIWPKET